MYEPSGRRFPQLALLWPAVAAASAGEAVASIARQFIDFASGAENDRAVPEPAWATPNTIRLELKGVQLRDFSAAPNGRPTLICAPFALHSAAVSDIAAGHSLVEVLRNRGVKNLFVSEWRSASEDMRFRGIDDYLADLNVLVDELGGSVDLVGLCQGGWMSLLYAARFPDKVHKLVVAGAPVDIDAAPSGLSTLVDATPRALFHELVRLGDGRALGRAVAKFWGPETVEAEDIHALLETSESLGSAAFSQLSALFRAWYAWTVDLPGTYYLEVLEKLYLRNELATGALVALGQKIDLSRVRVPLYLLAARDDELVALAQLFATAQLVDTSQHQTHKALAPCRHLGLFMGKNILAEFWGPIARWLLDSSPAQ